jgi:hypothetical protein
MKKRSLFYSLLALFFLACNNDVKNGSTNENGDDTTKFFQVNQFLQNQIEEVSATPFFIYKITVTNESKDSIPINTTIFNELARQFLTPDINDDAIKSNYTESIFEDQTTSGFTISYSTKNKELELQNVDVLLAEDGQTVRRIMFRKYYNYSDSSAIEQSNWKPGESFQINRSVQKPGNVQTSLQTTVVWNKKS